MTNQDNYCVIMGGGIGSRFWPFSRKTLPKQFLDFFGTGRSLLQQTFDRFQKVIPTENILIVTNAMYADLVKEQLPELVSKLAPGKNIYATDKEKAFIEENFPACPNVSIDFGIMEKADNVYVSLGDFGWSDLGTWGSLYDLSERDREGNVTLKSHSLIYNGKDNMIVLPKGKLAVIDGLEGYLIAESDNVLLICRKDEEHSIRKYVNDAQMQLGDDFI